MDVQRKKNKVIKIVNEMLSEKRKECVPFIKTWDDIKPKLKSRINEHIIGTGIDEESIILVTDDTISGSGKKGIVFTLTGFYCSESYNLQYKKSPMDKIVFPIQYNKIKKCELNANQSYINVVFQDNTVKYLYAGIYGIFVQELINNILECMKPDVFDYVNEAERLAKQHFENNDGETIKRSYDLYMKAIELGDVRSEFYAASIMLCEYSKGTIEFDYDKCLGWLKDAVAAGYRKDKSLEWINKLYEMDYKEYAKLQDNSEQKRKYVEEKAHLGNPVMMLFYGIEIQNTDKLKGIKYILTAFEKKFFKVKCDKAIFASFMDALNIVDNFNPTYEMIMDKRYKKIQSLLKQLISDDDFYIFIKEESKEKLREKIRKIYSRLSDTDTLIMSKYYDLPKELQKEFVMNGLKEDNPIFKLLVGRDYEEYGLTMEMQIDNISQIISEFSEDQIKKYCAKIFIMMLALKEFYLLNIRYYEACMIWWKRLSKYRDKLENYMEEVKSVTEVYEELAQSVNILVCLVLARSMDLDNEKVNMKYLRDYFKESDATRYQKVPLIKFVKMYVDEKIGIFEQMEIISELLPNLIRETGRDVFEMIGETILLWKLEQIYHNYQNLLNTQFDPKYEAAAKKAAHNYKYYKVYKEMGEEFFQMCCESYKLEKLCYKMPVELRKYLNFFKSMKECNGLLEKRKFALEKTKRSVRLKIVLLEMDGSVFMIETAFDPKAVWIDLEEFL